MFRRMGCWRPGSCSTKSTDRRRCRPRCPRRTDASWMDASVAARRRLGRLRRMTRIRRFDPVRGGQHRRRTTREQQLPERASQPRLSCLPPRGRHCLYTINAAAPVRVSDYLRWMQAAERGRSWRLRVGEAGEFTVAGPAAPVLAAGADLGCQWVDSAARVVAPGRPATQVRALDRLRPKSRRAARAPLPIASLRPSFQQRERNFWLAQPFLNEWPYRWSGGG